jgi:hypothetical protein
MRSYVLARVLLALSPLTICVNAGYPPGGCAHTAAVPHELAVALPPPPAFMAPIAEPQAKPGDDAKIAYRRTRSALRIANSRLSNSRGWYVDVRRRYGGRRQQRW